MRLELELVEFMPKILDPGVLYYAAQFGAAAHLCACGCGTKVRTPIGPTEWAISWDPDGVSLCPSVGNWQHPCRSHYWIAAGEIRWSGQWAEDEVQAGRGREVARRQEYFAAKKPASLLRRLWVKVKLAFGRR